MSKKHTILSRYNKTCSKAAASPPTVASTLKIKKKKKMKAIIIKTIAQQVPFGSPVDNLGRKTTRSLRLHPIRSLNNFKPERPVISLNNFNLKTLTKNFVNTRSVPNFNPRRSVPNFNPRRSRHKLIPVRRLPDFFPVTNANAKNFSSGGGGGQRAIVNNNNRARSNDGNMKIDLRITENKINFIVSDRTQYRLCRCKNYGEIAKFISYKNLDKVPSLTKFTVKAIIANATRPLKHREIKVKVEDLINGGKLSTNCKPDKLGMKIGNLLSVLKSRDKVIDAIKIPGIGGFHYCMFKKVAIKKEFIIIDE